MGLYFFKGLEKGITSLVIGYFYSILKYESLSIPINFIQWIWAGMIFVIIFDLSERYDKIKEGQGIK